MAAIKVIHCHNISSLIFRSPDFKIEASFQKDNKDILHQVFNASGKMNLFLPAWEGGKKWNSNF